MNTLVRLSLLFAVGAGPSNVVSKALLKAYQDELGYRMTGEAKRFDLAVNSLCLDSADLSKVAQIEAILGNTLEGYSPYDCEVYSIREIKIRRAGGTLDECVESFQVETQGVSKRFELRNIPPSTLDFSPAARSYREKAYLALRKCAAK